MKIMFETKDYLYCAVDCEDIDETASVAMRPC